MDHPYKEYENTELWLRLEKALNDLAENNDIKITTSSEHVIGYLCKNLKPLYDKGNNEGRLCNC